MKSEWNPNEGLTVELADKWRTKWDSLDLPAIEKRLKRLYDLRQLAALSGPEIPKSWRQFLVQEIDRGEKRHAKVIFGEIPPIDPEAAEALAAQCDGPTEDDLPESLLAEISDEQ